MLAVHINLKRFTVGRDGGSVKEKCKDVGGVGSFDSGLLEKHSLQ